MNVTTGPRRSLEFAATGTGWEAGGDGWSVKIILSRSTGKCLLEITYPQPGTYDGFGFQASIEENRVMAVRAAREFLVGKGLVAP